MATTTRWGLPYPVGADAADVPAWMQDLAIALDGVAMDDQGILASRPVSTAGTPGKAGRYYMVEGDPTPSNNGRLWRDNGIGWDLVGSVADGSVGTSALVDGAVTNPKLAANAVSTAKIADGSVTSAKIADGTVATVDLADGSVNSAKVADGSLQWGDMLHKFLRPMDETTMWRASFGSSTPTTGINGEFTINFPIAFPSGIATVVAGNGDFSAGVFWVDISSYTTTGFSGIANQGAGNHLASQAIRVNWIAVGF